MIPNIRTAVLVALVGGLASCTPTSEAACDATKDTCIADSYITFPIPDGIANLTTSTLEINVKTSSGVPLRLTNGISPPSKPTTITLTKDGATWSLPSRNCTVFASLSHGRLIVTLSQPDGSDITWPITGGGVDDKYLNLQYPRGAGRNIPLKDKFWNTGTSEGKDGYGTGGDMVIPGDDNNNLDMASNFWMPFWGYDTAEEGLGVAYMMPEDINTKVTHRSVDGSLQMSCTHEFSKREDTLDYTVMFSLTDGSPLASALAYRKYLQETNNLLLTKDKIAVLPDNARLLGAYHAYGFGESGLSVSAMKSLYTAGIKKLWIGYDEQPPMSSDAVKQAQDQGYLVGPYDTYANGQPYGTADTPLAQWPGTVYPDQCVVKYNGEIKAGFHNRGCYMSSQAQALAEATTENLKERLKNSTANGVKSYFLDVDAASEFFSDFSKAHPQNMKTDRSNRLNRMRSIADKLVLGSEDPHGWANTAVSYGHGSLSIVDTRSFTSLMNISSIWGNYAPANGPTGFFKPVTLPENYVTTMFDAKYTIPLTEAVLHDSVVNVDRWDLPLYKFPALVKRRVLQGMLYNVPMMWAVNGTSIAEKGQEMGKWQNFFQPLHEVGGLLPLKKFEYVTQDRSVQRTIFGEGELVVTVNFADSEEKGSGVGGECVKANLKGSERTLCV